MINRDSFLAGLKEFLDAKRGKGILEEVGLYLCNQDGILLYQAGPLVTSEQKNQLQAIGPLAQGAWQAAFELLKIFSGNQRPSAEYLRLAFDQSNSGLYMIQLPLAQERLSLCCCYSEVVNVGQLKNQLRLLKEELLLKFASYRYQDQNHEQGEVTPTAAAGKKNLLFSDITDDEVSNLFAGIGN